MSELRLVGLHEDGEHVVLEGVDGQRFSLPIDDALRAAVRRDRPQLEQVRAEQSGTLPPREIQARIRAGATAEELAEDSGMPLPAVRRYEGPVLAEREFVATQARGTRIGHDPGAPVLGDLVTDRLATRGVAGSSIRWDAFRGGSAGPWTVEVAFDVAGTSRSARWTFEPSARVLRAVDDEARWLSETELAQGPIPRRHLSAVPGEVFDVEVDDALRPLLASVDQPAAAAPHAPDPTHLLLDDLSGRRGVRQPLDEPSDAHTDDPEDDGEDFEGFGPQHAFDFERPGSTTPGPVPAAHPPASRPDLATDATVLELPPSARRRPVADDASTPAVAAPDAPTPPAGEADVPPPLARRSRRGRASVPSWDEIVFGAKPE
ncbi:MULTISPECIES: septation protein SepH [unclassified Actinotalea]|uniref:septation protein SepH n=1 Tax=unclassified Actinotalea TaxID=2638618 RepID=UPI0015F757BA|nr:MULTISPECIES: septation protein SepH [unclassified Actinotalea]